MNRVAVKVKEATPIQVLDFGPGRPAQGVQARRGKRLVEKRNAVTIE
jgi:hypothetical protein